MKNLQLAISAAILIGMMIVLYKLIPAYDLKENITRQLDTYKQRYNP